MAELFHSSLYITKLSLQSKESEAKKEADEKLEEIKQQGDNETLD